MWCILGDDMQATARMSLSQQLATFVAGLTYDALPLEVVARAKSALLDTLGAGLAAVGSSEGERVIAALNECGGRGAATVWGTSLRASIRDAALINGTLAHSRELDDYGGCGHSGAVVIPSALTVGEHHQISGKALLVAIVVGYDVAARVTDAAGGYRRHNARGWHSTGTCGSFGAAAAAASALGLGPQGVALALGIAGSFTGGLWAFINDGAMTKRLHPGKAAENGVLAAYLAKHQFTGPAEILEADWGGFLTTYVPGEFDPGPITDGLGRKFRILEAACKPYACCAGIHGALGALFDIVARHSLTADDVAHVTVRGSAAAVRQLGKQKVENTLDAQMSLPYSFAVALLAGRASIAEYTDGWIRDPRTQTLAERIELIADPARTAEAPKVVEVTTVRGQRYTGTLQFAKGHFRNPMGPAEMREKFEGLAAAILSPEAVARVCAIVEALEEEQNLNRLMAAVVR